MKDKSLTKGLAIIDEFRAISERMHANTMSVFIVITLNPGITAGEIGDKLGITQASTSRATVALGGGRSGARANEGAGLIEWTNDPREGRRLIYGLTKKGRLVAKSLVAKLGGDPDQLHDTSVGAAADVLGAQAYREWRAHRTRSR